MFVKRMALMDAFPFDVNEKVDIPNAATIAAFEESEEIVKSDNGAGFSTIEEMRRSMEADNAKEGLNEDF
jgi:antitoxin component of RelBE/YafQ-DinJ toxin-antitoxin module